MIDGHGVTAAFERALCDYCGAPHAVAVDCGTSALYLAMRYWGCEVPVLQHLRLPARTFRSVATVLIDCGRRFTPWETKGTTLRGAYEIWPTRIWDCALRFTCGMYVPGQVQCLSFTGHRKRLKLGRGGAILTDDELFAIWAREARFGHHHCRPCWMPPQIAALGCQLMAHFYGEEGEPIPFDDIENEYSDLREAQ